MLVHTEQIGPEHPGIFTRGCLIHDGRVSGSVLEAADVVHPNQRKLNVTRTSAIFILLSGEAYSMRDALAIMKVLCGVWAA